MSKRNKSEEGPEPGQQYNVRMDPALHDRVEAFVAARKLRKAPGARTVSGFCSESLEYMLALMDPETGWYRPPQAALAVYYIYARDFDTFGQSISSEQFADDADAIAKMDQSPLMVWMAGPHNECIHVNAALAAYTRRPAADFLRWGWRDLIHKDDLARAIQTAVAGFDTHRPFHDAYRFRRADGDYGCVLNKALPRFAPDGSFVGYIGTISEIPGLRGMIIPFAAGASASA